ncbi:MAG TPA: pilus assembly protein TadE [Candidatus Ruania gallistercoris]|uniref:Pilus assembly protein TadE n=1 Tax=Candidatus Ruania gallistercoris TaxID=2838746 RepID=A0A9D2EBE1_9MICO|nr:pilus assembly protein TadE [Candidatus Ruania gallistercoris]
MTAELAVLLPGVVLAIVVILVVASAGVMQVRCADAARAGARAAALGEDEAEVAAIVQQLAGDDARVTVTRSEEWVDVRVRGDVPLGPLSGVLHTDVVFSALPEPTGTGTDGGDE